MDELADSHAKVTSAHQLQIVSLRDSRLVSIEDGNRDYFPADFDRARGVSVNWGLGSDFFAI